MKVHISRMYVPRDFPTVTWGFQNNPLPSIKHPPKRNHSLVGKFHMIGIFCWGGVMNKGGWDELNELR